MKRGMRNRFSCVVGVLLLSATGAMAGEMPPMGLYQIDTDGTMAFAGNPAQVRIVTDGASGDQSARHSVGAVSATRQFKGTGPVTHCVKAVTGGAMPPQANGCKLQSTSKVKDGFVHSSVCPFGKVTVAVRQLDQKRWEYITDVEMVQTGGAPDLSAMIPLLKQQAEHGPTAEDRTRAKQQLAQLPQMQREGDATYAATIAQMKEELRTTTDPDERAAIQAALASMAPGTPTMKTRGRTVWTRIGDSCAGVK